MFHVQVGMRVIFCYNDALDFTHEFAIQSTMKDMLFWVCIENSKVSGNQLFTF